MIQQNAGGFLRASNRRTQGTVLSEEAGLSSGCQLGVAPTRKHSDSELKKQDNMTIVLFFSSEVNFKTCPKHFFMMRQRVNKTK